jgi:hypothetical protein
MDYLYDTVPTVTLYSDASNLFTSNGEMKIGMGSYEAPGVGGLFFGVNYIEHKTSTNIGNIATILSSRNSTIQSGTTFNNVIIGGQNHLINTGVGSSLILGGSGITATTSNTVYTPNIVTAGTLKVVDGTQQDGYVFTSDSTGLGSWLENPLGSFSVGKAPEAIPIHSLTAKGIPDGTVISGYTSIFYNNTDISGTLTTPFGTFNNTTGVFTTNTDCVLNIQSWLHLKADTSSTTAWESGATPTQIGLGICPNNATDIYVGDFLTILPSVSRGLDITTSITLRVLSGSLLRIKVLNQTTRAYPGSGTVSGDYIRFNITRID